MQHPSIDEIKALVDQGILGPEECPTQDYWHWHVVKPDQLPAEWKPHADHYNEVRWYG